MKLFIIMAALVAATAASPAGLSPFVMHGREAEEDEFPYAVGILRHYEARPLWCGGSLISANYVLTAAKCLTNLPAATIYLGAWIFNKPAQIILTTDSNFYVHASFDPTSEENDIALIRLSRPADLSHPSIALARLPAKSEKNKSWSGSMTSVYGWGYVGKEDEGRRGETPVEILHTANATSITNAACLLRYPAYIHSSNVCTHTDTGTPCDGDEGGGVMVVDSDGQYTQLGVHSYSFSLGCTWGWPAVHTRITSYLAWLENHSDVVLRD